MHELSFAEQILKCVDQEARRHCARGVSRVRLRVGRLSGVNGANLAFCLKAVAEGSAMEGAEVEVDEVAPELVCSDCGRQPVGGVVEPVCPTCGKEAELLLNAEVYIEEVELDVEDDHAEAKS